MKTFRFIALFLALGLVAGSALACPLHKGKGKDATPTTQEEPVQE